MAQPRIVDPEGRENGTERVQLRVTPSQRAALLAAAEREGITLADLCRRALLDIINPVAT